MKIIPSIRRLPLYQLLISIVLAAIAAIFIYFFLIGKAIETAKIQISRKEYNRARAMLHRRMWLFSSFLRTASISFFNRPPQGPPPPGRPFFRRSDAVSRNSMMTMRRLLTNLRLTESQYFFAGTRDGKLLPFSYAHNTFPHFSSPLTREDIEKKLIPRREKGIFTTYTIQMEPGGKKEKKISYIRWFPEHNLFIGTGILIRDIEKRIAATRDLLTARRDTIRPVILFLIIVISLTTSLFLYGFIRNILRDFQKIHSYLRRMNIEMNPINTRKLKFKEFKMLAIDANWMIRKLRRFTLNLERMLDEKGLLLKEIHHRIKNNFQIVSSIIGIQSTEVSDPKMKEILSKCEYRIRSIAIAHEKIYNAEDFTSINFQEYTCTLLLMLTQRHPQHYGRVVYDTGESPFPLSLEQAIPCALILNELADNAFRHAFPDEMSGTIRVDFNRKNNTKTMTIADSGAGIPERIDPYTINTLGFTLVRLLISQLRGEMNISKNREGTGTTITISFPD